MEERVLTRLGKYVQVVQKIGMMSPFQDKEFVGHEIPETGRTLKSVKTKPLMSWKEISVKHEGRPPLHSFNAHNVQKPTGTDKWAAE